MPDLPTRADYVDIGADEVLQRSSVRPVGRRLSFEEVFTEGSDINIILASASAMSEEVTRQLSVRIGALFLDSATGEDLDRLVADRFSPTIVRKSASPAVGTVDFFRVSGPLPGLAIAAGTRLLSTSGKTFETTALATLGAGSTGPVSAPVRALEAGLGGNVAAGTLTAFVTPIDADLQVVNPAPMAGGDDTESDASLRARARDFYRTARRGTLAAIEFGARTVPGVRQATAVEELDVNGDQTGRVFVFIADANGQANAALAAAVVTALLEYRAAGIIVDVIGAVPLFVPIQYRLQFQAQVDSTQAFAQVRAATVSQVNALAPQATLQISLLYSIARSVPGVIVPEDAIVIPAGDLVPAAGQVIRTRDELVTSVP